MDKNEKAESARTLKDRLEASGLWVESRTRGEDVHILVGRTEGRGHKVHLVIDGRTAEIRVKDDETAPLDLIRSILSVLTLSDGRVVQFSRQVIDKSKSWGDKVNEYAANVVQIGGIGSRLYTRTAFLVNAHGYLNAEKLVRVWFNGGGDVMCISPPEEFRIVERGSGTGNEVFEDDDDSLCRILLKEEFKNIAGFRAERRKKD